MDNSKPITMILAHPDDEVIFGWMLLNQTKKIICCSSDMTNTSMPQWKNRKTALLEVGKIIRAEIYCLDYWSPFSNWIKAEDKRIEEFSKQILNLLNEDDIIFSHNSWGEYKNEDHILINKILISNNIKFYFSDIAIHCKPTISNEKFIKLYKNRNLKLYNECKHIYQSYNCWTWIKKPIKIINLYEHRTTNIS